MQQLKVSFQSALAKIVNIKALGEIVGVVNSLNGFIVFAESARQATGEHDAD